MEGNWMVKRKWEYKNEYIFGNLIESLNEFGKDGWEVWRVHEVKVRCGEGGYSTHQVYLKRAYLE